MKSLLCRLAQRRFNPERPSEGWLSSHIDSCQNCQGFLEEVDRMEKQLSSAPSESDEAMCRDIMALVRKEGPGEVAALPGPVISPWGMRAGLAALLIVGFTVVAFWNPADERAADAPVKDPPVVEVEEPPSAMQEHPAQILATLLQQQEFLRRDARKLGMHLQERVILFKPAN